MAVTVKTNSSRLTVRLPAPDPDPDAPSPTAPALRAAGSGQDRGPRPDAWDPAGRSGAADRAVLGWTYLVNDLKIAAIGRYVRIELSVRLQASLGAGEGTTILGWETALRGDSRRNQRRLISCSVLILTFCAIPFTALAVYWMYSTFKVVLCGVFVCEAAAVVFLAAQFIVYMRPTPVTTP